MEPALRARRRREGNDCSAACAAPAACLVPPARSRVPGVPIPPIAARPRKHPDALHACTLARLHAAAGRRLRLRDRPIAIGLILGSDPTLRRRSTRPWSETRRGDDDPVFGGMAACPCVLVLCGAPAAGKSSLSRELRRHPARRVGAVHHISFDSIERESTVCRRRRSAERTLSVA
jgi:hypothetical protein